MRGKIIFKTSIKWILAVLCVLCIYRGASVHASAASPEKDSFYQDGDIVGFIGDSITHSTYTSVNYVNILNLYYLSRFPQRDVEFRNIGVGGYKANDVLKIYDQDPAFRGINKAVIMLGTNEAIMRFSPEDYIGNMEKLVGRLKEDGLKGEDILIITPPICDQNCSLNYGNRWTYESRLIEYMDLLENKTAEWGVGYLDIHTPMAELTEEIQQEDRSNTLTTDCIHPNTTGHMLIAYYILQAQGAVEEPLSRIFVPEEGKAWVSQGSEITDFYRGERGMSWTFKSGTLPMAVIEELLKFRSFSETEGVLYSELLQVMGLSEDVSYQVFVDETELGTFSGRELADGIEFTALENHPLQIVSKQIAELSRTRHRAVVQYRNMWIGTAVYSEELIQREHKKWKATDEELRSEMHAAARETEGSVLRVSIVEEGYSAEELERDKEEAELEKIRIEAYEKAQREAEKQARKEAQEQAQRQAEEQARRERQEQARKEAEEQALREAQEQAQREAEERVQRELRLKKLLGGIGMSVIIIGTSIVVVRMKRKS